MYKGSVGMWNPRIERVITIWYKIFCKLRVSFDGLITRKEDFLESSHRIETYIDVVVEVLDVHTSISFEFCLEEEFIKFW